MNWSNPYNVMAILARGATPLSMVVFLTMEIVGSQRDRVGGVWLYVIAAAALGTSIGIEVWGILAGSNLEKSLATRRGRVATIVQLVLYVALGMWLLWDNPTLVVLPIIAALVYVTVATSEGLAKYEVEQHESDQQNAVAAAARDEAAAERAHQLKLKQLEAQAQVKMNADRAEAEAKTAAARANAEVKIERLRNTAVAATPTTVGRGNTVEDVRYAEEAKKFHGMVNGDKFTRRTVEEILTVQRTKAAGVLKAGVQLGLWKEAGQNEYLAVHD